MIFKQKKQGKAQAPKVKVYKGMAREFLPAYKPDAFMSFISHGHEFDSPINLFIAEYLGNNFADGLKGVIQGVKSGDVIYQESGREDFPDIIFAVMPIWDTALSNEEKFLSRCYRNAMDLAVQKGFKKVVMPALGRGKSNFPHKRVVRLSLSAITTSLKPPVEEAVILCSEDVMYDAYLERLT